MQITIYLFQVPSSHFPCHKTVVLGHSVTDLSRWRQDSILMLTSTTDAIGSMMPTSASTHRIGNPITIDCLQIFQLPRVAGLDKPLQYKCTFPERKSLNCSQFNIAFSLGDWQWCFVWRCRLIWTLLSVSRLTRCNFNHGRWPETSTTANQAYRY